MTYQLHRDRAAKAGICWNGEMKFPPGQGLEQPR